MTVPPQITLDGMLKALAEDTWENLRESARVAVRYGEVTITDILMLQLRRNGFTAFSQTSLRDETQYGTDFECWVGSNFIGWIGYAVQAKKLDMRTGTYRNLGHVVHGTGQRQIDILRAYAQYRNLTPRYCLYNYSIGVREEYLTCCSRSYAEQELGCTLTPLCTIETALLTRGGKSFYSVQRDQRTVPWRCLAICPQLRMSLKSGSVSANTLSPLLNVNSVVHEALPPELVNLMDEMQSSVADGIGDPLDVGLMPVDFEAFGIGVDSREMQYGSTFPPRFIIPKRVYILELPQL